MPMQMWPLYRTSWWVRWSHRRTRDSPSMNGSCWSVTPTPRGMTWDKRWVPGCMYKYVCTLRACLSNVPCVIDRCVHIVWHLALVVSFLHQVVSLRMWQQQGMDRGTVYMRRMWPSMGMSSYTSSRSASQGVHSKFLGKGWWLLSCPVASKRYIPYWHFLTWRSSSELLSGSTEQYFITEYCVFSCSYFFLRISSTCTLY